MKKTRWLINGTTEELYIQAVQQALASDEHFNKFRQNTYYNAIVPHGVPRSEVNMLYNELIKSKEIMNKFETIKLMDVVGNPEINEEHNTCARNFKYMYAAKRIKDNFGDNIRKVVEIGVGYGGLCFTMGQYFKLTGYKLVDIDCVVQLAIKFLSQLPSITNKMNSKLFFNSRSPYDLCVSECALTELDDESIRHYYNTYLLQSQHLFIRTNFQNKNRLSEFIDMVSDGFHIKMVEDNPDELDKTVLLGWKK